jgi:lipopolysaccharide export system ATP-binding protein
MSEPAARLRAEGLTKSFVGRRVVDDVSIEVHGGEVVGLLGPNGAGKTTSFHMIVGLTRPDAGRVYLDDVDVTPLPMYERARRGIGYLPQEPSVFRKLTVEQNILAILETLDLTAAERTERLRQLLDELGIAKVATSKALSLSGGERRRL